MNKKPLHIPPSRLGIKILLYFLAASIIAVGLYFVMNYFSNSVISSHFNNSQAIQRQTERELADFQTYITGNDISTNDTDAISKWISTEKYVLMNIYMDDYLVFSSSNPDYIKSTYKFTSNEYTPKFKQNVYTPAYHRLYDVSFFDGTAQVGIYLLAASRDYNAALSVELVLSFAVFILIFLLLISRKFRDINRLQSELKIIEGGDLDRSITPIKGNDEISLLAQDVDMMRLSFLERIRSEKEAKRANSELITSISHDIRTPLTILIGNLDVIANKKYKTEEQLSRYIDNSRKKAYQLKDLSDKLFEYFLVFGSEYQEPDLEPFDCSALLTELVGEYTLSLVDQGRRVNVIPEIPHGEIYANIIAVRRIFDNLFSNILKYADPTFPVIIYFDKKDNNIVVTIKNTVAASPSRVESTNIGLATCEKIMTQHHGTFTSEKNEKDFSVSFSFPLITES